MTNSTPASPPTSGKRFLDLSGYGFSGKHAVIDLMREMQGFHVENFQFEFLLIRIQGGLLDLRAALVEDWSPIRSDAAIRRFRRLVRRMATKAEWTDPRTWFQALGTNYDQHYNNRFTPLSEAYINQLIEFSWSAAWPYAAAEWSGYEMFYRRLARKLRLPDADAVEMCLAWPQRFDELTRQYLADLLSTNVDPAVEVVVMHNAFEPFNPYRALTLFDSAKCIIVDRDPRDNYVAGLWYKPMRLPVEQFIRRYRTYRRVAEHFARPSPDVMRVQFEDLVLRYEDTLPKILHFLGVRPERHTAPRKYFIPEASAKNVGIWRNHPDQHEIRRIQEELPEYCRE
ncbi:MAG TPA: sulfotransferase [Lacunisphaera sp.]|nr:sulfotransferase [Lacunisphaera sp.]